MNMSPTKFHKGETLLQERAGVRDEAERASRTMMRDYMPDQHREFFGGLEYILIGTVDQEGKPHASLLSGAPGFVSSPDPKTLVIHAERSWDTAAFDALRIGATVGLLGIDLAVFRRNRMYGRITAIEPNRITITVTQSYGNCPKYINRREITARRPVTPSSVLVDAVLSAEDQRQIRAADTFFIASYFRDDSGCAYEGVDISHRGGTPGFVHLESDTALLVPDYRGNNLYNTFGNLVENPVAGLLFLDFDTGDELHIASHARIIEDDASSALFPEAQRILRLDIESVTRRRAATGLRWALLERSKFNPPAR